MKTTGLLPALQIAAFASPSPRSRERSIDEHTQPQAIGAWARAAADELYGGLPDLVAASVAVVARALAADSLANGRPPLKIEVTVTAGHVEVAATGRRSVAQRTLSHDVPALVEARKLTTSWLIRRGPGGRGSVVIASIPLRQRRFAWRLRGSR